SRILVDPLLVVGLLVLALTVLVAILAPVIVPTDPLQQNVRQSLSGPTWFLDGYRGHPFGTDQVGRDVLSNVISGIRISLLVGFAASAIAFTIGIVVGVLAGYFG